MKIHLYTERILQTILKVSSVINKIAKNIIGLDGDV